MSLVFGAICPHPPLLIPEVGQDNLNQVKATVAALKNLEGELYNMQPDSLVIISPHSPISPHCFSLNLAPQFQAQMTEFGDQKTKLQFHCDIELLSAIKEKADSDNLPVQTITQEYLDHGLTVPLYYLTQHLPQIKIVPISFSLLDLKTHYSFGQIIRRTILESNQRIAVIASGDLSHRLTADAPAGFAPEAKTFDQLLIESLKEKDAQKIINFNPSLIEQAGECGLRSILILLGALNQSDYEVNILSYEGPFGVGYLVAQFTLK